MKSINYSFVCFLSVFLIAQSLFPAKASADVEKNEEIETLREIPLEVRATILEEVVKEVDELDVDDIEREKKNGKEVYEVELEYKNKEIEIKISADGSLIRKTVEQKKEQ